MKTKPQSPVVSFKVNEDELEMLVKEAAKRKLSNGQTARIVMFEALSGFDQKQESFLRRFDQLNDLIELLIRLSSIGAAAATLPFDSEQDISEMREKLKTHINQSGEIGKQLVDMIKKGKL